MRIGIDAHMLGDQSGGNESFYKGILSELSPDPDDEYFLFVKPGTDVAKYLTRFNIVFFKSTNAIARNIFELNSLCKKYKLDVLHTQYYIPFQCQCKTVVTIHDLSFEHYKNIFTTGEYIKDKLLVPYAAKYSNSIVTVSEFSKKDITECYGIDESKITVVYNAVSPDFRVMTAEELAEISVREKYGIGCDNYFVCVSNLQPRKNIPNLIRAFKLYKRQSNSNNKLVLVGKKAWMYEEIEKLTAGDKDIILTEYVPKNDLVALLNEAAGFIYPSIFEGFGIPPLEALSCGTSIAVSDIPVMKEVLGNSAIYFDPLSEVDISKVMKKLENKVYEERHDLIMKYSWKLSAEALKQLYREITGTF